MSDPFASASEFCEWTGMPQPSDLARIQTLLDSASALIRGFTGQVLSQVANDTLTITPGISRVGLFSVPWAVLEWGEVLFLPEAPVTAITTVTVDTVAVTAYAFTEAGELRRTDGQAWLDLVTVVYDHGYAETSDEFKEIRSVCIQAAARAYTLNRDGSSEALGATLMESAGYAPEMFLTEGEKLRLPMPNIPVFG